MNDTTKSIAWSIGSVLVSLILVGIFHIGAVSQAFGTIAAGITNYTGISITGTPGTFDVSGTATFNGQTTMSASVGSISTKVVRQTLTAATTTPCAIQNPFLATSTIVSFALNITTGTSSAAVFAVGSSTTAFATTTGMVANAAITSSATGNITWDPGTNNAAISGSNWIIAGLIAGSNGAPNNAYTYVGTCQAVFQTVSGT